MVGASQTQDQGPGQSQGVQPTIPDRQQANRPEQLQPEQTAEGSSGSKHDADQSTWSAQLLTARRQLGAHPAYSVHTARSQMDIALKYIKVKEGGLERIRKQAETVRNREGMRRRLLLLVAPLLLLHSNTRSSVNELTALLPRSWLPGTVLMPSVPSQQRCETEHTENFTHFSTLH